MNLKESIRRILREDRFKGYKRFLKDNIFTDFPEYVINDMFRESGDLDYSEVQGMTKDQIIDYFFNGEGKQYFDRWGGYEGKNAKVVKIEWNDLTEPLQKFLKTKMSGEHPYFPSSKEKLIKTMEREPNLGKGDNEPILLKYNKEGKIEDISGGNHRTYAAFKLNDFKPILMKAYVDNYQEPLQENIRKVFREELDKKQKVFYTFSELKNHWVDDNDRSYHDEFFDNKDYEDFHFDNFYDMDEMFGHENSLFGTRGLPVGHPDRSSKSFDYYNKKFGPMIVRVIKNDDLQESIKRILREETDIKPALLKLLNLLFNGFDNVDYDWANYMCGMGECCDPYAIGFTLPDSDYDDYIFKLVDGEMYDDDADYPKEFQDELPEPCYQQPDLNNPRFDTIVFYGLYAEEIEKYFGSEDNWVLDLLRIINYKFGCEAKRIVII